MKSVRNQKIDELEQKSIGNAIELKGIPKTEMKIVLI